MFILLKSVLMICLVVCFKELFSDVKLMIGKMVFFFLVEVILNFIGNRVFEGEDKVILNDIFFIFVMYVLLVLFYS